MNFLGGIIMKTNFYKKHFNHLGVFFSIALLANVSSPLSMDKSQIGKIDTKNMDSKSQVKVLPKEDGSGNMTRMVKSSNYDCAACCLATLVIIMGVNLGFSIVWYYTQ
jgi:hypothetical protein